MTCWHRTRLARWLTAATFLVLLEACGPAGLSDGGSGSGTGSASGSMAGSGVGADASADVGSTGVASGHDAGGGMVDSASSATTDGATLEGGQSDAAPFVCPSMPMPGTCSPPADIRCPYPKLSQTGCVDPANPLKMASVVVPYEVNSPLWSDGALKTRGMRIPTGGKIHVKDCVKNPAECCVTDPMTFTGCLPPADDGKWIFPVGTVMLKNFMFADASLPSGVKLVETRLFIHVNDMTPKATCRANGTDCWVGYGYQWNEAQTEAVITSDAIADVRTLATFHVTPADAGAGPTAINWSYPSRTDCMTCHTTTTPGGGSTLGPETIQMNRIVTGDTINQIDKLAAMGLFEVPPPKPYKVALVAPYAGQAGSPPVGATLDQRARSYLHANCSFCHRPDGTWNAMDVRFDVPLKSTGLCNVMPGKGDLGHVGAMLLTPKDHTNSVVWLRMDAPPGSAMAGKSGRMPAIASDVIDTNATQLIGNWIDLITTCP